MVTLFLHAPVPLSAQSSGQSNQRFPAPLGIDRVLVGTVKKAGKKANLPKGGKRPARYVLSVEGNIYRLYGHETELKKLSGKKVRVTGNAVGNEITVSSVAPAAE